jgi:hypothetical protein
MPRCVRHVHDIVSRFSTSTIGIQRRTIGTLAMIALMMALPVARLGVSAQGGDLEGASPAEDHAEVIAQGVGGLPAGDLAWRLVSAEAQPIGDAQGVARALGFNVAGDAALLVTDENNGSRTRLGAGEASFVAGGATQRIERLSESAGDYWRIGLVPVDAAQDAGDDTLVFASDGFAVEDDGERDLDLVAAKLDNDESTTVASEFPVLVVVTSGTAAVARAGGDESTEIAAGDATIIDGSVDLTATEDGTRVLVAVIGAAIPVAEGDVVATPTDDDDEEAEAAGPSRIIVISKRCPVGVTAEEASDYSGADPCFEGEPIGGLTVTVVNTDTGDTYSEEVDATGGAAGISDIPAGDYAVSFDPGDGFGETVGVCGGQDQSAGLPVVTFAGSSVDLSLPADREYLCDVRTMTLGDESDDDSAEFGSIGVTFYACPAGMTFADLDPNHCDLITEGFDFGFQGSEEVHLADAGVSGGSYVWHNFSLDDGDSWSPAVFAYPDGYSWFAFSSDGSEIMEPHAGGYQFTSDQPIHILQVYFLETSDH